MTTKTVKLDSFIWIAENGSLEYGFYIERLQPLITKTQEQDIEMFLRIANDTPFHVMIDEETNV